MRRGKAESNVRDSSEEDSNEDDELGVSDELHSSIVVA